MLLAPCAQAAYEECRCTWAVVHQEEEEDCREHCYWIGCSFRAITPELGVVGLYSWGVGPNQECLEQPAFLPAFWLRVTSNETLNETLLDRALAPRGRSSRAEPPIAQPLSTERQQRSQGAQRWAGSSCRRRSPCVGPSASMGSEFLRSVQDRRRRLVGALVQREIGVQVRARAARPGRALL